MKNIKIFFNDRFAVLTDNEIENSTKNCKEVYRFENQLALDRRLKMFEQSDDKKLYIVHCDLDDLFENIKKCFKYLEAAGGVVMDSDGRVLIIRRLGKWDLPKGKAEKGESLQNTAIREVMEECGLSKMPEITDELTNTYHTYRQNGKYILKRTTWYTMYYDGNEKLKPQYSENITIAEWFPKNDLDIVMKDTYQSIKQVLLTIIN